MQLLVTDWAWLAGILDGEGCISFCVGPRCVQPQVQVINSSDVILDRVSAILFASGVRHSRSTTRPTSPNAKIGKRVVVHGGGAGCRVVLGQTIPYLVGKRRQAEVVLAFSERRALYDYQHRSFREKRGGSSYTAEDVAAVNEIRRLNFRGTGRDLTGRPELIRLNPTQWRGNGVICRNYRDALRSFKAHDAAAIGHAVDSPNADVARIA